MTIQTMVQAGFPSDYAALSAKYPADFPAWFQGWVDLAIAELEFPVESELTVLEEGIVSEKVALYLIESAISLYRQEVSGVDADGTKVEFQNKIKTLLDQRLIVEGAFERKYRIWLKQQTTTTVTPIIKVS